MIKGETDCPFLYGYDACCDFNLRIIAGNDSAALRNLSVGFIGFKI